MNKQSKLFEHLKFGELQVQVFGEKLYFPAVECAKMLGYKKPERAVIRLCMGVFFYSPIDAEGEQRTMYIPEGDLYRLIIRSKNQAAEDFEIWVCDEILPSMRREMDYAANENFVKMMGDSKFGRAIFMTLYRETERNILYEDMICKDAAKVRFFNSLMQSTDTIPVSVIAKDYGMSAFAFNKLLHRLDIQDKFEGTWMINKKYTDLGYAQLCSYADILRYHWTHKGRFFLYETLAKHGYKPSAEQGAGVVT
jgi:prophage antirepressor-like protein